MDASLNAHRESINWKEHASEITDGWEARAPMVTLSNSLGIMRDNVSIEIHILFKPVNSCVVCCSAHHSRRSSERDKYSRVNKFGFFFKHNYSINPYVPIEPRRDPSNGRLYEHGIRYISDTARNHNLFENDMFKRGDNVENFVCVHNLSPWLNKELRSDYPNLVMKTIIRV